jgi:periplasmic protein TonB
MKAILAGTWPPLKPLPIFKYETVEYRATIDFDKKRGEWVCRKTSLPSNRVQELRGGLREITMALPHGEGEMFTEGEEPQEQELEKDTNRRLQAIHEWREKYENGARYFELRDYLSESQRTEIDDSLRLSLTARQLQFNSKNVAYVFDALATAGGRFASLIELAKRNKTKHATAAQSQGDEAVSETEGAINYDEQSRGLGSRGFGRVLGDINPSVPDQDAAERCTGADEFPAVSIKDVFPEKDQASLAERMAPTASQQFEIATSEIVDADSASLDEYARLVEPHSPAFTGFAAPVRTGETSEIVDVDADSASLDEYARLVGHHSPAFTGIAAPARTRESPADRIESPSWPFPALEISAFHVAVFGLPFLFAVIAFAVGLTVGRGPHGRRPRGAPKSIVAIDAKAPTLPDQADESASRTPSLPVPGSDASADTNRIRDAAPPGEKSKESTRGSEYFAEVRPTDSDSSRTAESKPSAKPEVNSEHSGATGLIEPNVSPPASSERAPSPKAVGEISSAPRSPAQYRPTPTIGAAPHLPRPSAILVTVPSRGSQPFRFPEKAIAATSSFAMTSQLSVLVSPEPGPAVANRPARLEAGELVSFVWPRYPKPGRRHGLAETIRVRAAIGELGHVMDVKFLSGSISLLPATVRAIRQWRYRPTLLDQRPVQAQEDITIEFRPPQYSWRVSTQHPSH